MKALIYIFLLHLKNSLRIREVVFHRPWLLGWPNITIYFNFIVINKILNVI